MDKDKKEKIIKIMKDNGAVAGFLFGSYARNTASKMSDIVLGNFFTLAN